MLLVAIIYMYIKNAAKRDKILKNNPTFESSDLVDLIPSALRTADSAENKINGNETSPNIPNIKPMTEQMRLSLYSRFFGAFTDFPHDVQIAAFSSSGFPQYVQFI